jgi:hypothetical protein
VRTTLVLVSLLALWAAPLAAQRARVEIALPGNPRPSPGDTAASPAPVVRTINVLTDRSLRDLLHSGFPARLHYRVELWSASGFFDDLIAQADWDVIVRYDPLERRYTGTRIVGDRAVSLGSYADLAGIERALARPYAPSIRSPTRHARYYYVVGLDVAMLSVNDLDEVQRWLNGELTPAVKGKKSPGTALGRGARTLITRLLGGEDRHYEARTREFHP